MLNSRNILNIWHTLNSSSPGFSASKSYNATQQGCWGVLGCGGFAGDRIGDGKGDAGIDFKHFNSIEIKFMLSINKYEIIPFFFVIKIITERERNLQQIKLIRLCCTESTKWLFNLIKHKNKILTPTSSKFNSHKDYT